MEVEEAEAASRTFAFFFNWYAYVGTRLQKKAREEGRGGGGNGMQKPKKKLFFKAALAELDWMNACLITWPSGPEWIDHQATFFFHYTQWS